MDRHPFIDHLKRLIETVGELHAQDRSNEALELSGGAVSLAREIFGPRHPDVSGVMNILAGSHRDAGAAEAAEALYLEAVEIAREALEDGDSELAAILNNLATLYRAAGRLNLAKARNREALRIYRIRGDRHPDVAIGLTALAKTHEHAGEYLAAEPLYIEALEIWRGTGAPNHDVAAGLNNLAELYRAISRFGDAQPMYQEAETLLRSEHGPRHPGVGTILNNRGLLSRAMGDFETADSQFRQALEILRDTLGPQDPHVATTINNIAELLRDHGRYPEALPLQEEALTIRRKALGPRHPEVGESLNNLALLHQALGDHDRAEGLFREALELAREVSGPRHPRVALTLNNLATLQYDRASYAEAEPLYLEALEISRETLGPGHPDVWMAIGNLAMLCAATGRDDEAMGRMEEVTDIEDGLIGNIFAIGSERQRMAFAKRLEGTTDTFLSLVRDRFPEDPVAGGKALGLVLRRKALGAEAVAAEREAVLGDRHPELAAKLRELRDLRMQIAATSLAGPGVVGGEEHRRLLESMKQEKESLESELARGIPEIDLVARLREADCDAVAGMLPSESVLVELLRFDERDLGAVGARDEPAWKAARYAAFVLRAGQPNDVRMVDLGEAGPIDELIARYRGAVTGHGRDRAARGLERERVEPSEPEPVAGAALRGAVFDPLRGALGGLTRVFLAPDGDLARLPFEVLPTEDGGRLIETYTFSYLSTGRDVLRFEAPLDAAEPPLVAAAPDFDLGGARSEEPPPGRRSRDLDPARIHFGPLAGTEQEAKGVAKRLRAASWLGEEVLEASLKARRSPRILHLATHGFFLPDQPQDHEGQGLESAFEPVGERLGPMRGAGMENPLLRSGLALAGANTFLAGGTLPEEAEDGILTAEDVSGLDLLGTELVVLSACETGLGEVRVGEGVFGLRRAFVLAGARTLVMSLWKVPDGPSAELMQVFYENLDAGTGRAEALREAQLAMAKRYPPPWFWGAFICQGDPGPLPLDAAPDAEAG